MENAIEMARENGFGLVGVRNSSHCGALSFFAYQAMKAGLIGLAMTQTDIAVVPFGGVRPFLGTNPLCFGIPSSKGTPIVLDMATSTVAGGHIFKARAENRPIPEGRGPMRKENQQRILTKRNTIPNRRIQSMALG
jgi:ureidoglycolate dehydrogenase (NAD+)